MTHPQERSLRPVVALVGLIVFDGLVGFSLLTGPSPLVSLELTTISDEAASRLPVIARPRVATPWFIAALGLNVVVGGSSGSSSDSYELGPFSLYHHSNAHSSGYTSFSMGMNHALRPPTCRFLKPSEGSSWDWTSAEDIELRRDSADTLLVVTCQSSHRVARVVGSAPPPMTETMVHASDQTQSAYRVTRARPLGLHWWSHRLVGLLGVAAAVGAVGWLLRGWLRADGEAATIASPGAGRPAVGLPLDLDEVRAWATTPVRQALLLVGPVALVLALWAQVTGQWPHVRELWGGLRASVR